MSQNRKVLDYMERHGSITPMDAVRDLGIMRLAARIWDLTGQGVPIAKTMEKGKNRDGEDVRYARYVLMA